MLLKKFVKDMAKYLPSQLLPALTAFITTPILTRLLPPAEYGYWALAASIAAFLVALASSGFGAAVIRFYPAYKANSNLNIFHSTITISVSIVIAAVAGISVFMLVFLKTLVPAALYQLLPLVIMIFIAQSVFTIYLAMMRAQERSGAFTSFQLIISYGGLLIGLLFVVVFDLQATGLLWGVFITHVLALPFLVYMAMKGVDTRLRYFQLPDALQIWQYAWPLILGNVAMWGLRLSDLFIISFFQTERDVGLYTVSYNISAKSIELLVSLFLLSVSPLIMNTWESKGQEATEKTLTMITRVYLLVCLPAAVGVSVLAYPFVALLTAQEYHEGYKIVGFVVFSSFAWGLANIAMMGVAIKKQVRRLASNQIVAALIHIVLAWALVPYFGYAAAAFTTLIGYTTLLVLHTLASRSYLTWRFPISTLFNVSVASAAMGIVAYGIYHLSDGGSMGSVFYLFLSVVIAVPVYVFCIWMLGEMKKEEQNMILQLFVKNKES